MTQYAQLKLEEVKAAYSAMTDAQKVVAINALDVVTLRAFNQMEMMIILVRVGDWGWLSGVADGFVTSANASGAGTVAVSATTPWLTRRTALALKELIMAPTAIDATLATTITGLTTALNTLVTANVIQDATRTALLAVTSTTVKWPLKFGWAGGVITINDLVACRTFP